MAEIKLYGNTVNGDGKYIVSPFDIAAPKSDGKSSYVEDNKAANKNIVSYINSQVANINTSIGAVKTGIQSVSATAITVTPGTTVNSTITVTGKDGSSAYGMLNVSIVNIDNILENSTSYTNTKNAIETINGNSNKPGSFREGDKNTLEAAKTYTTNAVNGALGSVYKIQGTKTVAEVKALTKIPKGYVYNISEPFKIGGKKYPEYTNLVFIKDLQTAAVTWDSSKGFDSTQVDALGGVVDLEPYSLIEHTVSEVLVTNSAATFLDTGNYTTLANVFVKRGDTSTNYPVTAKLPTTLAKVNNPKLTTEANKLKLTGLTDLSGNTVTPLSYKSVIGDFTTKPGNESDSQQLKLALTGELGSTYTSPNISLTKASSTAYGVVKIGDGFNNNGGYISIPKNTFNVNGTLNISYTTNSTGGKDFTLKVNCNTEAPASSNIIPIQECGDKPTLGIKINEDSEYVKLTQVDTANITLGIDVSGLDSTLTLIKDRITALETLLLLA